MISTDYCIWGWDNSFGLDMSICMLLCQIVIVTRRNKNTRSVIRIFVSVPAADTTASSAA